MRQVYKGEIEEKLLSRSLQPLNEAIMNTYEKTVKHYFHFNHHVNYFISYIHICQLIFILSLQKFQL